jgi:hypothetical protein
MLCIRHAKKEVWEVNCEFPVSVRKASKDVGYSLGDDSISLENDCIILEWESVNGVDCND